MFLGFILLLESFSKREERKKKQSQTSLGACLFSEMPWLPFQKPVCVLTPVCLHTYMCICAQIQRTERLSRKIKLLWKYTENYMEIDLTFIQKMSVCWSLLQLQVFVCRSYISEVGCFFLTKRRKRGSVPISSQGKPSIPTTSSPRLPMPNPSIPDAAWSSREAGDANASLHENYVISKKSGSGQQRPPQQHRAATWLHSRATLTVWLH